MTQSRSRKIVLLLDCCYAGAFGRGVGVRAGDGVDIGDQFKATGHGHTVITASSATEYAFEGGELTGEGRPSVFTSAVVEALATGKADRDQDHEISVSELYEYVCERVHEQTPNQQPNKFEWTEGPLYVAHSSYEAPVQPARLEPRLVELMNSPLAGGRLGAVEELNRLAHLNDRATVVAARQALEPLLEDDSRQVVERATQALDGTTPARGTPRREAHGSMSGEGLLRPADGREGGEAETDLVAKRTRPVWEPGSSPLVYGSRRKYRSWLAAAVVVLAALGVLAAFLLSGGSPETSTTSPRTTSRGATTTAPPPPGAAAFDAICQTRYAAARIWSHSYPPIQSDDGMARWEAGVASRFSSTAKDLTAAGADALGNSLQNVAAAHSAAAAAYSSGVFARVNRANAKIRLASQTAMATARTEGASTCSSFISDYNSS